MSFLTALMRCATSPIRSEILPRPNNSRTTAITTIQCQMLSEPILQPSKHARPATRPNLCRKLGAGGVKNKDLSRVKSLLTRSLAATVNWAPPGPSKRTANLVFAPTFRLCGWGQREFQIADLQRLLVIAQGRVIRRRWDA